MRRLKLAFVSGLSDKKLAQKLAPLQAMPEVRRIDLYRRQPFHDDKVRWMAMPVFCSRIAPLGDLWRLATLFKNAPHYDVLISCHQFFHGVYVTIVGISRGKLVVQLTIKDPARIQESPLGRWALRHADAIGFRGQTTLDRFRGAFGNNRPLFVPQNVWQPSTKMTEVKKSIDVLYVGNFAPDKNISAWLETAAEVKRRRGSLSAVLVGDKPNRRITALVNRLRLSDDLEFPGLLFNNELDAKYMNARIFLLTSHWEGLPMAALEAMAAGMPVVATNKGDIQELVKQGENGYLVAAGDVEGTAKAVERLLDDERLYLCMSKKARKSAMVLLSKSTLEYVTEQWQMVFNELGLIA